MPAGQAIAAIATAPGRGGIGVVRISGLDLTDIELKICGRKPQPRHATLCKFLDGQGRLIDRGLAVYFDRPHSYTGEDVLELQVHCGPVTLKRLLARCVELGVQLAEPGEFTKRAFINGKLDLAQAEGVADLINAATEEAAHYAVRSLEGEFSAAIQKVAKELVDLRTLTEAHLDFPEEELDASTIGGQARRLQAIEEALQELLAGAGQGRLLREGAVVVLAGRPNVGKSSLLNRLAGEEVAIVTDIPGTTRDAIRQSLSVAGVPIHVVDTAGLRDSDDPVEQIGISRTWKAIEQADLALLVQDASCGETEDDREIDRRLPEALRRLRIINKADLTDSVAGEEKGGLTAIVSAKTGQGIPELKTLLAEALGWKGSGEGIYMARERHLVALSTALSAIVRARTETGRQELFAEELRAAHDALMSITGEMTADDLLGEIFSRFCIGK